MEKIQIIFLGLLVGIILNSCLWKQVSSIEGVLWIKYSGNPLELGTTSADSPCVLYNGSMFKMWYQVEGADKIVRICYATSIDAINWVTQGTVLDTGETGSWDSRHVSVPAVLYDGNMYRMWYVGVGESPGIYGLVGYATSSDGVHWSKYAGNPVMAPGGNGGWDDYNIGFVTVLSNGTHYLMWYVGQPSPDTPDKTGFATSVDGTSWEKFSNNPVLVPGPASWDERHAEAATVLWNGTQYLMWYNGQNWASKTNIGLATSTNGSSWTKYACNPVLETGTPGSWDAGQAYRPSVVRIGNRLLMFYIGREDQPPYGNRLGLALSYLPGVSVNVDICPDTLNLKSQGRWITACIELPDGYNVADVNVSTISLNGTVPAELTPTGIGDYDNDDAPDLMLKFDRAATIEYILDNVPIGGRFMTVTLTVTGNLLDGTLFQGSDTIKIISPPPSCHGILYQMLEMP